MNPRGPTLHLRLIQAGDFRIRLAPHATPDTLSKTFSRSFAPRRPSKVTRMPLRFFFYAGDGGVQHDRMRKFSPSASAGEEPDRGRLPGASPGSISTTETFEPSAAYTVPSSRPMYPPPITSKVPGTSLKSSAAVESITRGVSSLNAGMIAGREPVARMMRSKLSGLFAAGRSS